MDLVSSCKDKLTYFRIKELKDVLTHLGLAKQGKKQDLVDRILAFLSDEQVSKSNGWPKRKSLGKEGVAKIIDDTYRKMQSPGATDLASKSQSSLEPSHVGQKEELNDSSQLDMKVRCLCGSSLLTESMIKCEDPRCRVWQHISCVIIPEKALEGVPPEVPSCFYCEICRINRADPFWVTLGHPLFPVKLPSSGVAADGANTLNSVERTFQLSRSDRELLQRTEYDLQVWCILLNDKVPFRMQWPQYIDLQVNGVPIRTINRPGTQLLGANGRDDGPVITTCSREGINKICLSKCDARIFCFGIRIAKRRTVQQILSLVPKEEEGEPFEDAVARVRRCIGGGTATENADSDSDIEVVANSVTVNLRCPMSGSRMKTAGRFKPCVHMGCFDLETFVELNQRSRKWQCPICLKNYSLENIIIDPYFNRITSLMQNCGEDVTEIDVKPDGSWRAKNEAEDRDLSQWHLYDSSLCPTTTYMDVKPDPDVLKQIKQEVVSEGHTGLKLGIKRNRNGIWEVSKPDELGPPSSENCMLENCKNHCQNIMPVSSSASGSYRDGEDPSVNQEDRGQFDFSLNNGHEFNSLPPNFEQVPLAPLKDVNVIVLSDSEDDNVTVYDNEPAIETGNNFSVNHPGVSETYTEDLGLRTSGATRLGLFNNESEEFGMPLWSLQTVTKNSPGLQLFGTDSEVQETLPDINSLGCPISNYGLVPHDGLDKISEPQDLPTCRSNTEVDGSLVDNPLAFGREDPSLQIFLPNKPVGTPLHADSSDITEMANGVRPDDWISLRLGTARGGHGDSPSTNGLNSTDQHMHKENGMETLANTAPLLTSTKDERIKRVNPDILKSDSPFSHPRQPRSVRPRLSLSIDRGTDSNELWR